MDEYALPKYRDEIPFKDASVPAYLNRLKKEGHTVCVLTASPHKMVDPCLKRLGVYDLFDFVWSCDDFNTSKADPAIYHMAAERMGVPVERVLFLDDNYNADKTAAAAGMTVCGVYDDSSAAFVDEIKSVTHFYINTFAELPAIVW